MGGDCGHGTHRGACTRSEKKHRCGASTAPPWVSPNEGKKRKKSNSKQAAEAATRFVFIIFVVVGVGAIEGAVAHTAHVKANKLANRTKPTTHTHTHTPGKVVDEQHGMGKVRETESRVGSGKFLVRNDGGRGLRKKP